jgi:hypothetical protein
MLTNEMQMRAELLGKVLETGVPPMQALDHARQLWDFIDYGNNVIEECGVGPAGDVIGAMVSMDGIWQRFDGSGRELDWIDFDRHPVYSRIRPVEQDGQAMVEIPAFYVRVDHEGGLLTWAISDQPVNGFTLHPAFRRPDGTEASAIRVGAYAAGRRDDAMVTAAGLKPWTSIDFTSAQEQCEAIGPGWRMWSIYDLSAIQILMMIEKGGADMQTLIARGNVDGGGVLGGGESNARWRGLHELWGNVWQMVDGLRIAADGTINLWSADRPGSGEWVSTGVKYGPGGDHGFPVSLHDERGDGFDLSLLFLPSEVTSDEDDALIGDWVWGRWEGRETVAYHGGSWSDGSHAGLFDLHLNVAPSNSNTYLGARLAKVI